MTISKTALLVESIKRKGTNDNFRKVTLSDTFPQQNAFINDPSKFIAAQCSRRAGKSNALALKFFKTMEKYPKSQCLYLSLTQDSARSIMWPILQEIDDKYKIGCEFTETKLEVKHPNGAKLKLMGADLQNFIKRLRGRKYPGVAIDEVQDMGVHIQSLIDDVLTWSLSDYKDGWLAITGTPGPVPTGYFFDVTNNNKYGYSVHKWTMRDNPYMPDTEGFLDDLLQKRGWTMETPTVQREYLNQWVLDTQSLWIKYNETVNDFKELPSLPPPHKYQYIMGVDIGYNDADALAVVAWSEVNGVTYLVEESVISKQGITALVRQIDTLQKKYNVYKILMDEGGLGKKVAEDIRSRFGCPLVAADKAHKQSNVEFLNDAMRLGKFKAQNSSRFAQDSYIIQIDHEKTTPTKIVIKRKPHSDIIDAVLYAFRESYAHTFKQQPNKPPVGSKEWLSAQAAEMWDNAMNHYTSKNDPFEAPTNKWIKSDK